MCGLTGILHRGRHADAATRIRAMADSIRHRGPDDEGFWSDGDVSLGFRRLSIVDLEHGTQPMPNEDGTVRVLFNGEIYNHPELRRELARRGHRFATDHSDTEVLVHGWEEWGERLPERLNGMFAFAVWDARRKSLFIARDRLGVKPLYLARSPKGALLFGSEARTLFASGLVERRESADGVLEYLTLMNNWHGRTPFAGVSMLEPGTWLFDAPGGARSGRFWSMRFPRSSRASLAAAAEESRDILMRVMDRQMAADVPVKTYLSGGIDSSAVTAAAHRRDPSVTAYSCIFQLDGVGDDRIVDEREFSRAVAAELGIDRVEVELPQDALTRTLDATVGALEYPRMGMAYVNYLIAQTVARDAKVVLSGMGGDEITGGYVGRYAITPRPPPRPVGLRAVLDRFLGRGAPPPAGDGFAVFRRVLNVPVSVDELTAAFTPEFLSAAGGFDARDAISDLLAAAPSDDPWDVVMYADTIAYLHGLLVLEDKLSMAHSLETRVPLLDNEWMDYMLDLPWPLLADGETGKIVFREAVRPWVPEAIYGKPKMGFGPPDASWYRGRLRPWIEGKLDPATLARRGIFQPAWVRRKLDEHFSGAGNHVALIWCLLSLESWCEQTGLFGGRLAEAAGTAHA